MSKHIFSFLGVFKTFYFSIAMCTIPLIFTLIHKLIRTNYVYKDGMSGQRNRVKTWLILLQSNAVPVYITLITSISQHRHRRIFVSLVVTYTCKDRAKGEGGT